MNSQLFHVHFVMIEITNIIWKPLDNSKSTIVIIVVASGENRKFKNTRTRLYLTVCSIKTQKLVLLV